MKESVFLARVAVIVSMLWLLTACCQPKLLGDYRQDSVRVEVVENIIYVPDTIIHEVPLIKEVQMVRDTASYLSNAYAESTASVATDGTLTHSLSTIPQPLKLPYKRPVIRRDSIVYRNVYNEVKVEVERELTWWQQTQIKGFWAMLVFVAVLGAVYFLKKKLFS